MTVAASEALLILAAVAAGHATQERIATATGLPVTAVRKRLQRNGSQQFRAAFKWFVRTGETWSLTHSGINKLKGDA